MLEENPFLESGLARLAGALAVGPLCAMRGFPSLHPQRGAPTANHHPRPAPAWPHKHQTQPEATLSLPSHGARKTNNRSFLLSHESLNSVKLDSNLCSQLSHQHFQALGR